MNRFYVNIPLEESSKLELPIDVIKHLFALRIKNQEKIVLFNGDEYEYLANITSLNKKSTIVEILKKQKGINNSSLKIQLGISVIANDKMDLIIQKSTELGVSEIIPIISERSQRIYLNNQPKRLQHWQKIIISSCEQCGRNSLNKVQQPINLSQLLIDYKNSDLKLILSPHNTTGIHSKQTNPKTILLLVGPEGGFTNSEIELFKQHDYKTIKLGENILRAETAAIAGISLIQTIFGDFKI